MRGGALPGKSVLGDAPAQARQEARQGCGGRSLVTRGRGERPNIFRCYNCSFIFRLLF